MSLLFSFSRASRGALCAVLCSAVCATAVAGDAKSAPPLEPTPAASSWVFSHDVTFDTAVIGGGRTDGANLFEQSNDFQYVLTSQYKDGPPLRLGVEWVRDSFSRTAGTRVPNTLQSISVIAGVDLEVFNSVFIRLEAQPGFYSASSNLRGNTIDVPVTVGGSYVYSKDVQLVLGVEIDPQRKYPVLPGGGIRWQINDKWLLDAVLPKPRLEYQLTHEVSVYGGANLVENSYRTDSQFGNRVGNSRLNGAWLDYEEVRVGGGATVKLSEKVDLSFEIGYLAYREFQFHRADFEVHETTGGIYGGMSLGAKF